LKSINVTSALCSATSTNNNNNNNNDNNSNNNQTITTTTTAVTIERLTCGNNITIFQTSENRLFVFGSNKYGMKDLSFTETEISEIQFFAGKTILKISCGENHMVVLLETGAAFAIGDNTEHQCGVSEHGTNQELTEWSYINPDLVQDEVPIEDSVPVIDEVSLVSPFQRRSIEDLNFMPPPITTFIDIACGRSHTLFVTNRFEVYAAGNNTSGQLGLGAHNDKLKLTKVKLSSLISSITNKITNVYCHHSSSFIVTQQGEVWACGANNSVQLGLGGFAKDVVNTPAKAKINKIKAMNILSIQGGKEFSIFLIRRPPIHSVLKDIKSLGLGAEGQVLLCEHIKTKTKFAVKKMKINNEYVIILV